MATLKEPFSVCPLPGDKKLLFVTPSGDQGCFILTNSNRSISVYKIEDQKNIRSWSVRHGVTVTSPVIYSEGNYVTIDNKQDIKMWTDEDTNLEKVKKKHLKVPVYRVLSVPNSEAVVLFDNGAVEWLSRVKQVTEEGPYKDGETLRWCDAVRLQEDIDVCSLTQIAGGVLSLYWYKCVGGRWNSSSHQLPFTEDQFVSCCCIPQLNTVKVYTLCKSGDIYCTRFGQLSSTSSVKVLKIPPVETSAAIVAISDSHIAVTGTSKEGIEGIVVYDVMFGSVQAWRAFPAPVTHPRQLFVIGNHLLIMCGQSLYAYEYTCEPSSLARALGSTKTTQTSATLGSMKMARPVSVTWRASAGQVQEQSDSEVLVLFDQLSDPLKTATLPQFRETFTQLMERLQRVDHQHLWTSQSMSCFIHRCVLEKEFWARDELLQIIQQGFIPPSVIGEFFEALIRHSDLVLLHASLSHLHDIPEAQLINTLTLYLRCPDVEFTDVCDEMMKEDDDEEDDKCQFGLAKALFINTALSMPYNDVFLLECLRDVNFEQVLVLMQYLYRLLNKSSNSGVRKWDCTPSTIKIVDWLCLLVDAHATQLIISPDARTLLVDLHQLVHSQMQFYDELISLEAILSQLKEKCLPPQQKGVGQYCIEVLHIY